MRSTGCRRSTIGHHRRSGRACSKGRRRTNQGLFWRLQNRLCPRTEAGCRCRRRLGRNAGRRYFRPFASCHEGVTHCSLGFHPSLWIPDQTLRHKVYKFLVVATQNLLQCLCSWSASPTFGVYHRARHAIRIYM